MAMESETLGLLSDRVTLKRDIGLVTGCFLIIGSVIGSGIFVSPQGVLLGAGSYGLSLIIWSLCGVLSLSGALTYAEIGTSIPCSGGAYYPIRQIYGDCAGFVYMFTNLFFTLPAGIAICTLTCAEYVSVLIYSNDCGAVAPDSIKQMIATTFTLFITAINAKSVSLSGKISNIFTVTKILSLAVIIIGGLVYIAKDVTNCLHVDKSFKNTSTNLAGLAEAFLSGMWAYGGWENLNFITEELKNPERNLPLAMFISLPVVTSVYLLANIAYFAVLFPPEVNESMAVAMTWANVVIPQISWFVPLAVAVSTFGASSGLFLFNSRLPAVTARENHLPSMFSFVHIENFTPIPAVFLLSLFSCIYLFMGTINELINYIGIVTWFFHGMIGLGLLILRYKERDIVRPYKAPLLCPVTLIMLALLLSFGPVIGNPQWGYFFAIGVGVMGILFWLVFVKCGLHIPGTGKVTELVQLLLRVIPPEMSKPIDPAEYEIVISADSKPGQYGTTGASIDGPKVNDGLT